MMELPEFFALQMKVMETMDIELGWLLMKENGAPSRPPDDVILISLHKARLELTGVDLKLRLESVEWLRARGYARRGGMPLPPPGVEPF